MSVDEPTADEIAARLSAEGGGGDGGGIAPIPADEEPVAAEPTAAFDLSKLSPEQLMGLRDAMAALPQQRVKKRGNPIVKLRRIDGRIVVDFKNCFQRMVKDENTQITAEAVMIPVSFMDETGKPETETVEGKVRTKWTNVLWKDFMNSDQMKCEVIGTRRVPGSIIEGEVESNERPGVIVEMEVRTIQDFFTVKLPEGSPVATVEIEGKIANA